MSNIQAEIYCRKTEVWSAEVLRRATVYTMAFGWRITNSLKFLFLLLLVAPLIKTGLIYLVRTNDESWFQAVISTEISSRICSSEVRGKSYFTSRILYSATDVRTFQLRRIILGGDIHKNPGPTRTTVTKYACKECDKTVRSNQNALLCAKCNGWGHAKCLGLNRIGFKYYKDYQNLPTTYVDVRFMLVAFRIRKRFVE